MARNTSRTPSQRRPHAAPAKHTAEAAVRYRIEATDLHAHLYGVTLTIQQPAAGQRVSLPVWIAGSYMVREFAKQITHISARQAGRTGGFCTPSQPTSYTAHLQCASW